jgi:hypothetical protein
MDRGRLDRLELFEYENRQSSNLPMCRDVPAVPPRKQ